RVLLTSLDAAMGKGKRSSDPAHAIHTDIVTCTACLCFNALQMGENDDFGMVLLAVPKLIEVVVQALDDVRRQDEVASNVLGGYLAVWIGTLSLVGTSARIQVITELSQMKGAVRERPMKMVVAVLQELVLFKSSSGLLTKSALLSLHRLIDRLMESN